MCHTSCYIMLKFNWIITQHNLGYWCSGTVIVLSGGCKRMWFFIDSDICIYRCCGMRYGYGFSLNDIIRCIDYIITWSEICLYRYWLFIWYINVLIGLIMIMWIGWSCLQRPIGDTRSLPVLFQFHWPWLMSNDIL